MMNKKIGILIAAAVGTMMLLPGCTEQSVTYDPNAAQATSAPAQAVAAATATPTPTATPTAAATATPTVSVTATPTPTEAPVITPIAPIEITPTVNPDAGLKLIGEKKEGDSIFKARLKNGTNFTIAWFSVKDNFTDYYPKNQLGEKENIEKGETRVLYYDAAHAMRESADREEKAEYLIRFAIKTDEELKDADSEGHYYIIHNIPFEDLEEAEICFNEQTAVPYIKYKSKKSGALVSTEKEETAIYGKDSSEDDSSDNGSGQSSEDSQGNASPARDDEEESNRNTDADDSNTGNTNNSSNNGSSNNGNTNTGNTDTDDEEEEPEDTIIGFDEDPDANGDEGNGDEDNNDDEIIYYDDTYDNVEAVG